MHGGDDLRTTGEKRWGEGDEDDVDPLEAQEERPTAGMRVTRERGQSRSAVEADR